ncbi:GIY-YIG nuclease family protein [Iningainema tapete]|uniref:GIY-YIG nuclease family protein n=1 Tax=Iningainema tapete BLCC-T55 TaxID=2748662 RepID=A0A8J6XTA1_9CYAN|nr:GIY-YIG nuclease family protein [Iningainema tapete]MBD2778796.1 GIY-YIG nuclease family protein [Iningainema tapete BLCC-T55]
MSYLLDQELFESSEFEDEDEFNRRGQAGRNPAQKFAAYLKRQGFLPTSHFAQRFLKRVLSRGVRFDPSTFKSEFLKAKHYRQTRSSYNKRFTIVRGVPIVYRPGGENGNRIVLITTLAQGDKVPPMIPTAPPHQRETEAELQQLLEVDNFEQGMEPSLREIEHMVGAAGETDLIPLKDAPNKIKKMRWQRGIYVIFHKQNRVYVGKAIDIPRRIREHRLCLTHLKIPLVDYKVKVFHYPNANENTLLAREREYRQKYPRVFSHLKDTEMEDLTEAEFEQFLKSHYTEKERVDML